MEKMAAFKSGFVAIVGPTNSGKSTLMNHLIGEKVSIVSHLPQTTYHGIRGILSTDEYQVVFTDTPGLQRFSESFPRLLNRVADRNAQEADLILWVFDASAEPLQQIEKMKDRIAQTKDRAHSFLALNKVDKVAKPELLPILEQVWKMDLFSEIIPLSAVKGVNTDAILKCILPKIEEGPVLYDPKTKTDRTFNFRVAETIREKIYRCTRQELPYSVNIETEAWEEDAPEGKVPMLNATIHVDSTSRKKILIGHKGEMLKRVGTMAREDIEKLTGRKICLKLHVDVQQDWRSDANHVNRYLELS